MNEVKGIQSSADGFPGGPRGPLWDRLSFTRAADDSCDS